MRYAQRGGYTPAEQQRRERLRLEAAGRFARGDAISEIAHDLRVTEGSVRRWYKAWRDGGDQALRSKGPVSREKLSPQQWARLEAELRKGPLAHGSAARAAAGSASPGWPATGPGTARTCSVSCGCTGAVRASRRGSPGLTTGT